MIRFCDQVYIKDLTKSNEVMNSAFFSLAYKNDHLLGLRFLVVEQ